MVWIFCCNPAASGICAAAAGRLLAPAMMAAALMAVVRTDFVIVPTSAGISPIIGVCSPGSDWKMPRAASELNEVGGDLIAVG